MATAMKWTQPGDPNRNGTEMILLVIGTVVILTCYEIILCFS